MNKGILDSLAKKARHEFESGKAYKHPGLKEAYSLYNPRMEEIKSINNFFDIAKKLFPCLNCGITSVYLNMIIPKSKIKQGRFREDYHTFLLVRKDIIIDITSDQFNGPKIYVGPIEDPWSL